MNGEIDAITATRQTRAWIEDLTAAGVPCGEINTIDQVFADPQVRHLGLTQSVETPVMGAIDLLTQPVRLGRTPSELAAPPPERGEQSDEVLGEFGFSEQEIADLRRREIIGGRE